MEHSSVLRFLPGSRNTPCVSVPTPSLDRMPSDVIEHMCSFLGVRDVLNLACSNKLLRNITFSSSVWSGLLLRSFSAEELPKDLSFLSERDSQLLRVQFQKLTLQRPAFLSDAPRTSEIIEHTGSRFSKVLHIDGRRDLNFTTVFRAVPHGQYAVVWRLMLQPGYVRGYCNFRPVFSRPASLKTAGSKQRRSCNVARVAQHGVARQGAADAHVGQRRWRFGRPMGPQPEDHEAAHDNFDLAAAAGGDGGHGGDGPHKMRLPRGLHWLSVCISPAAAPAADPQPQPAGAVAVGYMAAGAAPLPHQPAADAPAPQPHILVAPGPELEGGRPAGQAEIEPLPVPAVLAPPAPPAPAQPLPRGGGGGAAAPGAVRQDALQRRLASASAKRDAALAAGGGGPRYVPGWLAPLWGSHACSWRQLDPAGPLGHGSWRSLHLGSLTVRRSADVHLHSVMVQLRPPNAAAQQAALPHGETRWRGALVDYVELVPVRRTGVLRAVLPGFLLPSSPVFPEMRDVVEVPGL